MKKRLIPVLLALALLLCGCGAAENEATNPQVGDSRWGIALTAQKVSPTGMTLRCAQYGGQITGELSTGSYYVLERSTLDGWQTVEYLPQDHEIAWTSEAWIINLNSTVRWEIDWEWLYGPLPAGEYRIGKEFTDLRAPGDYDETTIYARFRVE